MITFLGLPERTAGIIRGKQISNRLEGSEFLHSQNLQFAKNKICIFIRNHFQNSAAYYKSKGHIVGYDICDMHVAEAHQKNDKSPSVQKSCHDIYDFYIVNNTTTYNELIKVTNKPIFIVPHHTTNFDKIKIEIQEKVKNVGYIGLKDQFSRFEEVQEFLKKQQINFISAHPKSREECDEIYKSIDIGLIFLDENSTFPKEVLMALKKYKPNTKISNFQSYGIPVISVHYDSYKEFGKNAFVCVDNYDDMIKELKTLINDKEKRQNLSNEAYKISENLHINNVIRLYQDLHDQIQGKK